MGASLAMVPAGFARTEKVAEGKDLASINEDDEARQN